MAEKTDKYSDRPSLNSEAERIDAVLDAIASLRFGAIQLTIHEGKLVQIDVTEKRRFT